MTPSVGEHRMRVRALNVWKRLGRRSPRPRPAPYEPSPPSSTNEQDHNANSPLSSPLTFTGQASVLIGMRTLRRQLNQRRPTSASICECADIAV